MDTLTTMQKDKMSNSKRFDLWLEPNSQEILESIESGKKAKFINEAIQFYDENKDSAFTNEKAAKVMADRVAHHLKKVLDIG
jgi:hypothetical protein